MDKRGTGMRDSYDDMEEIEYEDELDRMRNRKSRQKQRIVREPQREPEDVWEDLDIYGGEDDYYYDDEDDDPYDGDGRYEDKLQYNRKTSAGRTEKRASSGKRQPPVKKTKKAKKKRKGKRFLGLLLLLCVLLAGLAFSFWRSAGKGYWTVAVYGVDSRDGGIKKGALTDVVMVCTVNRETGEIKLLSVFRDTYVQIDKDGNYHKLNEAYFKGGPEQGIYALEENFDLKIDDYATFNWKAVADTINILGGIDLEITDKEFAYINSFITETVQSTGIGSVHLQHSGMNHLDGVQAVAYARLRLMDTDFKRTERQRKVIGLAMEKAKQADIGVLNNIVVTVLPQLATSVDAGDLLALAKNIDKYHIGETSGFPFAHEPKKISGRDCVIPATLESNVIQLHQFLYGIEDFKPSQSVKKINARIIQDSGIGEVGKDTESGKNIGGSGSSQTATKPPETQPAPPPAQTNPPETPPESIPESLTEESAAAETGESIEIPETIPVPETAETEKTTEIGPGIPSGPEIPTPAQPETDEKPTIEEVGPGVNLGPGVS